MNVIETKQKHTTDFFIVTFNSEKDIALCLDTLLPAEGFRVVVFDNGSTDETLRIVAQFSDDVSIVKIGVNGGYAAAVNKCLSFSQSDICVVANADVKFCSDFVTNLKGVISHLPDQGRFAVAGLQQLYFDGSLQQSYRRFPGFLEAILDLFCLYNTDLKISYFLRHKKSFQWRLRSHYIDGALLIFNGKVFDALGGFDESFFFFGEEADFCARALQAGEKISIFPTVTFFHRRGGSSRFGLEAEFSYVRKLLLAKELFVSKHGSMKHVYRYLVYLSCYSKYICLYFMLKIVDIPKARRAFRYRDAMLKQIISLSRNEKISDDI